MIFLRLKTMSNTEWWINKQNEVEKMISRSELSPAKWNPGIPEV